MLVTKYKHFRELDIYDRTQIVISYILRLAVFILFVYQLALHKLFPAFLLLLFLFLTFIPALIEHNYKITFPIEIDFITTVFIFLSLFLGDFEGVYQKITWWDIMLHTSSGVILGFIGFVIVYLLLRYSTGSRLSSILIVLFSFCFAVTIGVLWEFVEFSVQVTTGYVMQPSLRDTIGDLFSDALGALFSSVIVYLYVTEKSKFRIVSRIIRKVTQHHPK